MNPNDTYTSPLATRNASPEMLRLWSPRHKFNTWRRIWLAVAEAQYEVTKDWGSERARSASEAVSPQRAPTVREGSASSAGGPLPHGRGSSGPGASRSGPLVTREQVEELRSVVERGITDEEIARAAELERDLRHDVMSHVHCLGEQCPKARAIIHLGMTSQDVVCNADLIVIHEATEVIQRKAVRVICSLGTRGDEFKDMPALGFTHYQPAQPTTIGRRLAEYAYHLHFVVDDRLDTSMNGWLVFRGLRGATGTQASFLKLFDSDSSITDRFEGRALLAIDGFDCGESALASWRHQALATQRKMLAMHEGTGDTKAAAETQQRIDRIAATTLAEYIDEQADRIRCHRTFDLTGQTYPRVFDSMRLADLASVAAVLHKIATDIRLLSNRKELDEPFGKNQIGSSAMPYKRNPMKCERICGLARFVMNLVGNGYDTAATQWLERTLDDSSNRRLSLPEAFLALDGCLDLMHEVASGLVVHEAMVRKNLMAELPFLATENILMEAVKAGGDRQEYHEIIRTHAQSAGMRVKQEGLDNDLLDRLQNDKAFWSKSRGGPLAHELDWSDLMDPMKYIGRSVEQTERFLREVVDPLRERYADQLGELGSSDRGV